MRQHDQCINMSRVCGFAPIEGESARILILGSMPGVASLTSGQYYAHPRNAFWKIVESLFNVSATASYDTRVAALQHAGIAVWDVLESCTRTGSLDAKIDICSASINNINALLKRHPLIETICLNGSTAERIFKSRVLPTLENVNVKYVRLPSTSPAHATTPLTEKILAWQSAIIAK